jgi:hypothetical protein
MQDRTKVSLYLPNKDFYGNFVKDYHAKIQFFEKWLITEFGGFSMYEGYGGYENNTKSIAIHEAHRKYEIIMTESWDKTAKIQAKCVALKKQFKQECILLTYEQLKIEYI